MKYILPIILIGISIAAFFMFIVPTYKEVTTLRIESSEYNQALANSKSLENERDKLTKKYNTISPENLVKLEKLLPNSVDNIRLILEIEKIAAPYGMFLKDVKYDSVEKKDKSSEEEIAGADIKQTFNDNKDFGFWNLEFSTQGSYNNFLNFSKDLENNLRIVDIVSVQFSSDSGLGITPSTPSDTYKYLFKIKTYWLKN